MPRITFHVDNATKTRVKRAARAARKSQSRWVADLVREKVDTDWPNVIRKLLGSCPGFPSAEEIRAHQR